MGQGGWGRGQRGRLVRVGLVGGLAALGGCRAPAPPEAVEPRPVPDIQARAVDGTAFRMRDHRGRVVLLTFGHTACEADGPGALARVKALLARLGPRAAQVAPVFVAVDPEQDTPERLHAYLHAFDGRFRGLSLARPALRPVLTAFGVAEGRAQGAAEGAAAQAPCRAAPAAGFFFVGPGGQLRLHFPPDATAEQMAPAVLRLLDEPRR